MVAGSLVGPCCRHARSLARIRSRAVVVRSDVTIRMSRDPKDDKFLEYAVAGRRRLPGQRRRDLLVLGEVQGIPIVLASVRIISFWPATQAGRKR